MKTAMILAGGSGTRLGKGVDVPKCMLLVKGKTLLDRQLEWLESNGFNIRS